MFQTIKSVEPFAWPIVALVIFFFSRKYIDGLAGRIQRVKVRDVEVELKEKIISLATESDLLSKRSGAETREGQLAVGVIKQSEIENVKRQPVAAIMNKWEELENVLYRRITNVEGREWRGTLSAVDYLVADGVMTVEEIKLFNRLHDIRNIVAHEVGDSNLSAGYAFEFLRTANLLIAKLGGA